jgi:hypothetical protein
MTFSSRPRVIKRSFRNRGRSERICLNRVRCRSKRGSLETITARAPAESHLIDISLVYRKTLAHRQPEFVIDAAKVPLAQHGAGKNEGATASTLMAFPFSQCQLSLDVGLSEVNEINSSELAHQMDREMRSLHDFNRSMLNLC